MTFSLIFILEHSKIEARKVIKKKSIHTVSNRDLVI